MAKSCPTTVPYRWLFLLIALVSIVRNEGSHLSANTDAKLETSTLEKEQSNDSALQAEDRRLRRLRKRKNTVPSPSTLSQTPTSSPVPLEVSLGAAATAVTTKRFDRIIIIVHENTSYDKAMKNQYFGTNLTSRGALFTAYNALMYGNSYPEYMAMTGGNTYTASVVDATCIADLLEAKGLTWRNYLESYPGNCFLGDSDPYVERHSPFVSYKSIQNNKTRCNNGVVNLNQFNSDWKSGKLPTYSLVSPNQNHNGHAGDISKSVAWTKSFLEPLLADKALMNRTLIVLTFDEVTTGETGYHIYALFIGSMVKPKQTISTTYTHYSLLRTVEDNFSLGNLGKKDALASSMTWVSP